MTESDLQAYRALCQRWRECATIAIEIDMCAGELFIDEHTPEATVGVLIGHLESLLPPGQWSYMDGVGYSLSGKAKRGRFGCERTHTLYKGKRLSALLAAVEAVMGAKGGGG